MMKHFFIYILVTCFFFACAPEPEDKPLSSEEVATIWLQHFYKDELQAASLYSTDDTQEQLLELAKIIYTGQEIQVPPFNISLDTCVRLENRNVWHYTFKDTEESFTDSIVTIYDAPTKTWLVDEVVYEQ